LEVQLLTMSGLSLLALLLFNGLISDKDSFLIVGLWGSPFPNLGGELGEFLLVDALEDDPLGGWDGELNALGDVHDDGMGVAQSHDQLSVFQRGLLSVHKCL
jgi:hypothetical protein